MPARAVTLTALAVTAALLVAGASLVSHAATTLDYDYFKAKVQPIFLTKRAGHARCVMCHETPTTRSACSRFRRVRRPGPMSRAGRISTPWSSSSRPPTIL
jgi:hypothetical protein